MLIDELVAFCDKKYTELGNSCGNGGCSHPRGSCSGGCYNCLFEVHYPSIHPNGKREYDCPKMLYHYVCQYSYLYATEMFCAFTAERDFLMDFPYFNIISLGCGACPDLMAFEEFYENRGCHQGVSYIGFDKTEEWSIIHNRILDYCKTKCLDFRTECVDVLEWLKGYRLSNANVIVLGYLISYIFDMVSASDMEDFITNIARRIVSFKQKDQKLLLIVNDLNTYKRGRDYMAKFCSAIREQAGIASVKEKKYYFDTGDLYGGQKIGNPHSFSKWPFVPPEDIRAKYHACTSVQKTIQYILEVQ